MGLTVPNGQTYLGNQICSPGQNSYRASPIISGTNSFVAYFEVTTSD
jgi:hypothetical protein